MKKKIKIIGILLVCIGLVTTVSVTYSRYISNSFWNYYLKSQHFYLESDMLSINGTNNTNTLWDGEQVKFTLKNYINNNLITENDITYKAECSIESDNKTELECKIDDLSTYEGTLSSYQECINETNDGVDVTNLKKTDCEINGYTYIYHKASKELHFEVIAKENINIDEVKVKITVTSIKPYKKTIVGYFDLNKSELSNGKIEKNYKKTNDYSSLILTNMYNEKKCINVKWNESTKFISNINNDYDIVSNENEYINEINVEIDAKSNKEYFFYDKTTLIDDFEIKETECNQ